MQIFLLLSFYTDFIPTVDNNPPSSKKSNTGLIVGIVVPVAIVSFLSVFVLYCFVQRRKRPHGNDDEGKNIKHNKLSSLLQSDSASQQFRWFPYVALHLS